MATDGASRQRAPRAWWAVAALALGTAGFCVGATGGFGHPSVPVESLNTIGALPQGAVARDCPAGKAVSTLLSGSQVLIVARSADWLWFAVRSANRDYETVWVAASEIQTSQVDGLVDLPVDGCIVPLVEQVGP